MVSIAKIPSFGLKFTGFLSVFLFQGKIYKFATYTRAKVDLISIEPKRAKFILKDKHHELHITARKKGGTRLPSPSDGEMSGRILESLTSEIDVEFYSKGPNKERTLLFKDTGIHSGLEIMATLNQLKHK